MSQTKREIKTTLALDGEKQFKASMDEAYRSMKVLGSEMKVNTAEFGKNAESMDGLTNKGQILEKQIAQQKEIVEALTKAVTESAAAYGESDKKTDDYRIKLNNATAALTNMEGELKTNQGAIENFGQQTEDAEKKTESWKEKLGSLSGGLETATGVFTGLAAGMAAIGAAAIAVGKQLFDLTTETGIWADELITTSVQTGISTTALQEWGYAAQFIDTEVEVMTGSMAKMIRQLDGAREGTGASAEAFATLGVSVTDSSGQLLNSQDIFFSAIDALGNIANETERDALAMQLFGKSAQELNPLIEAGSTQLRALGAEAQAAGIIMGEESVAKLGAFDDKMNVFNSTITGMKNNVALALTPAMGKIIEVVQNVASKFAEWLNSPAAKTLIDNLTDRVIKLADNIGGDLDGVVNAIINAFDTAAEVLGWVIDNIDLLISVAISVTAVLTTLKIAQIAVNLAMSTNPIGLVITAIGLLVAAVVVVIRHFDDIKKAVGVAWEAIKSAFSAGVDAVVGFFTNLVSWFGQLPGKLWDTGVQMVQGLWNGIQSVASWIWEKISGWIGGIWKNIKGFFGISSPSKLMADTVGKPMAEGIALGLTKNLGLVDDAMSKVEPMLNMHVAAKAEQSVTANFSDSALARIVSGLAEVINNREDMAIVLNDREFGRAVRRVAPA